MIYLGFIVCNVNSVNYICKNSYGTGHAIMVRYCRFNMNNSDNKNPETHGKISIFYDVDGGSMTIVPPLRWEREPECPWESESPWDPVCTEAALTGQPNVVRRLLKNGHKWTMMQSGKYNNLEILQLAYENRVPYPEYITTDKEECLIFLAMYGDAWKKNKFSYPHYWK